MTTKDTHHGDLPQGFAATARRLADALDALNNSPFNDALEAAVERSAERREKGKSLDPLEAALIALESAKSLMDDVARYAETGEVPMYGFGN